MSFILSLIVHLMATAASGQDNINELPPCIYTDAACSRNLDRTFGIQGSSGTHLLQRTVVRHAQSIRKKESGMTPAPISDHPVNDPHDPADADKIRILHIGKTGGMTLSASLGPVLDDQKAIMLGHSKSQKYINETYFQNISDRPAHRNLIFFVRSPVHRFTSAWLSRYGEGKPEFYIPWTDEERWAFETFPTPDKLACALSSSNPKTASDAKQAMMALFHVSHDIAWFLDGLLTVRRFADSILFVGRTEHFDNDYTELVKILKTKGALVKDPSTDPGKHHATLKENEQLKKLGQCAVRNLHQWYHEDYAIIQYLADCGLIDATYPNEVDVLDAEPPSGKQRVYFQLPRG